MSVILLLGFTSPSPRTPTLIKPTSANTESPMDSIDTYFPYSEYRPGQRHMLEVAAHGCPGRRDRDDRCPDRQREVECRCLAPCRAEEAEDRDRGPDGQPAHHVHPRTRTRAEETAADLRRCTLSARRACARLAAKGTCTAGAKGSRPSRTRSCGIGQRRERSSRQRTRSSSSRSGAWTRNTRSSARITSRARCSCRPRPWVSRWSPRQSSGQGPSG